MASPSRYPDELHRRAVRLVFEARERTGERRGAISGVADRLGVPRASLGRWVRQAEVERDENPEWRTTPVQPDAKVEHDNAAPGDTNEILVELRQLRSFVDHLETRRRRRARMLLAVILAVIPLGVLGAHLAIDYESGRVADSIQASSGPFTDEALRRVCKAIKIPLFGPETKKRLHCPPSAETDTTNQEPPTTTPPSPAPDTAGTQP